MEFGGENGGLVVLVGGREYLHSGWQQLRAAHLVTGLAEQPSHGRDGRLGAAVGEPQQRQPRLRFVAVADRALVRRLRSGPVAANAQHIAAFGHRQAGWSFLSPPERG